PAVAVLVQLVQVHLGAGVVGRERLHGNGDEAQFEETLPTRACWGHAVTFGAERSTAPRAVRAPPRVVIVGHQSRPDGPDLTGPEPAGFPTAAHPVDSPRRGQEDAARPHVLPTCVVNTTRVTRAPDCCPRSLRRQRSRRSPQCAPPRAPSPSR